MEHDETPDEINLTIDELSERTQTSVRTVRYYIAEGLLPGPGARGKGASYSEEHLLRLRLIRRLTERRAPLAEIREVMARVTPDEIRALLAEEDARAEALERAERAQAVSPRDYIAALLDQARAPRTPVSPSPSTPKPSARHARYMGPGAATQSVAGGVSGVRGMNGAASEASAWRRVELAPGVELHIRLEAEEQNRTLIERLIQISEDESLRQ
jgi:DNA-binding transcriptional MerR regulator